ncbi:MAG: hypothetical protein HUU20_25100 [Pirellulales bacterium]|nr:hypothetical protein [Pirellulales bacterium]
MKRRLILGILLLVSSAAAVAEEAPYGKGMSEENKQRVFLDDMEEMSDWYNGSPDESKLSNSTKHVKQGEKALLFANVIDHTKGETNYPIGWPRTGKDLGKEKLTDFSKYDFFECWIYVETSRQSLPSRPISVGFYHSGHKRTTHVSLEAAKDQWTKIIIPTSKLLDRADVPRLQFNISESDYMHGDRVDFYIDDVVLTRYVEPAINEFAVDRNVLFSNDRHITAVYSLVGSQGMEQVTAELAIGRDNTEPAAKASGKADRRGDLSLPIDRRLEPGTYWARFGLRDAAGNLVDRKQVEFRVMEGPF